MKTLEEIRDFFKGDAYATSVTGIVIDKAEIGHSSVSLVPDERHMNAVGGLMGAVYFTMADFAFAVAENCGLDPDSLTVTQSSQVNLMRPWKSGKVICNADIIKDGRATCVYEVKILDEAGRELALIITNGFKKTKR